MEPKETVTISGTGRPSSRFPRSAAGSAAEAVTVGSGSVAEGDSASGEVAGAELHQNAVFGEGVPVVLAENREDMAG
jgi:hypothetical protein